MVKKKTPPSYGLSGCGGLCVCTCEYLYMCMCACEFIPMLTLSYKKYEKIMD